MSSKNKYRIYFKWLGGKKRIDIEAFDINEAESILYEKLEIIHTKLIEGNEPRAGNNPNIDFLKGMFNMK